jgi:hypothetical protein
LRNEDDPDPGIDIEIVCVSVPLCFVTALDA